jgi:mannose-1-phosphate guanylyltransferase
MRLIPTILCGGVGSRLWPVSRELHPKPFIRMAGGMSLLQEAFVRGASLDGAAEVLTVTGRELLFKTKDEYAEVNARSIPTAFLLEPFGRGTAAAIASAALHAARAHGDDAILLAMPADHLIADRAAFASAVAEAARLAAQGRIVTFGVPPESPETAYGYIEARGHDVLRFVEKPAEAAAREYLASGRFLWNSGMFCFGARAMLGEMRAHCPGILDAVARCLERSARSSGAGYSQVELHADSFAAVPDNSIDYALMEKTARAAVVRASLGWRDVGSWSAMADLVQPDANGNRLEGEAFLHDASGCYIRASDRAIGVVGAKDLVIVDTDDALLIADKARTQEVKQLYAKLQAAGHEAHKLHRTVHRPWGTYTVLEVGEGFKIKGIVVKPGASLSLQMHHHRSEHWVVVSGEARIVNAEREMALARNQSTYIPAGCKHRLANAAAEPLVMIEVQCGAYVGEDDIVRFDDVYGRVEKVKAE